MWIESATERPELLRHVAQNMRALDREEIFATRWTDDTEALVAAALATGPISWVAGLEAPIAAFGCAPLWPGVWSMWLMATDDFRQIRFSMTKLIVRSIVPMLFESGAHRLEARSMEGHDDAHAWLEVIGAKHEGTIAGYGREGQYFRTYAWSRP